MSEALGQVGGVLLPRVCHYPAAPFSSGAEFVELAASAGLVLDDWQGRDLELGLGETADGQWAAFQVTEIVPRQNGKDAILEALGLGWLFLTNERLIGHSAHEYKTAMEAFRRLVALITNTDDLRRQVKKIINTNGEEGIELLNGNRMRFLARSKGAGRGFSFSKMILNEAYALTSGQVDAILPTMSAMPNPQVWLTSSPPLDPGTGEALFAARRAALAGAPGVVYLDYGLDGTLDDIQGCATPGCSHQFGRAQGCVLDDMEAVARVNPAFPHRVSPAAVRRERAAMDPRGFARERYGIWPADLSEGFTVISKDQWDRLADPRSGSSEWALEGFPAPDLPVAELAKLKPPTELVGTPVLSLDVSPRSAGPVRGSLSLAQRRFDGKTHLELVLNGPGSTWFVDAIVKIQTGLGIKVPVVVDPGSPAGSVIPELEAAGIHVETMTSRDVASAFGMIYDAATGGTPEDRNVAHLGQSEIMMAIAGAEKRPVGDGHAWDRRTASADITPLVSVTHANWGVAKGFKPAEPVAPWVVYA
jgi:hypothetical protein